MAQHSDQDEELELTDYVRILRRRLLWVLLPFAVVTAAVAAFTAGQESNYCSTARVLLADSEAQVAIRGSGNAFTASRDLANEISIADSDQVRGEVEARLGFAPNVRIQAENDADVLVFEGCANDPEEAAAVTGTYAEVYVSSKRTAAADSVSAAIGGFQERLSDLRAQRQELRAPIQALEDRRDRALTDESRAELTTQIDRLNDDLAVEIGLIDSQIEQIASSITLLELDTELARTGTARIIQDAAVPGAPTNAPLSRNLIFGGLVGLILGAGLALVIDNLDRSIKTSEDINSIPVLGSIPRPGRELAYTELSLAAMNHTGSALADGYQKVRTAVEFALIGRKITSLLITSPSQAEGKTTTSANLAWAMSAVDHRVVLADVDFRRPRIHEVFGCPPEPGLSDNLLHGTPLNKLALRVDDERSNMVIIPTGAQPPSPGDFVASPAFSGLLRNLEAEADLVILDGPPVLPVSDALSVARQVDAVIVVAMAGRTSRVQLERAVESLRRVGADVLGVCLVGVKSDGNRYGYGYSRVRRRGRSRSGQDTSRNGTVPVRETARNGAIKAGESESAAESTTESAGRT